MAQEEIKTIELNNEKFVRLSDIKVQKEYVDFSHGVFKKGDKLFIRSVTHHYLGRVVYADDKFLVLEDASWVAIPKNRHGDFLKSGPAAGSEIEVYPSTVTLNVGALLDWSPWNHELPTKSTP